MERIPLFTDRSQLIDRVTPRDIDHACRRCSIPERASPKVVCMNPEGDGGGVLFVSESPAKMEDQTGRPLIGVSGTYLRQTLRRWWQGPVAFDNAIRCAPGKLELGSLELDRCRPYLAATIREVAPQRIIALGAPAVGALLGRKPHILSARRGYAWLDTPHPIPVFFTTNPAFALRNRFQQQRFEEDLQWALTCDPARDTPPAPYDAVGRVVLTLADARAAAEETRAAPWFAYDAETAGLHHEPGFEMLVVSTCAAGSTSPWIWGSEAFDNPDILQILVGLLEDRRVGKVGQNIKYDNLSVRAAWGAVVRPVVGDTMLYRALLEPDCDRGLELLGELVGCGGHKEEAHGSVEKAVERIRESLGRERKEETSGQGGLFGRRVDAPIPGLTPELSALVRRGHMRLEVVAFKLVPRTTLYRYNALDAMVTALLATKLGVQLEADRPPARVWHKVVRPAAEAVEHVQWWGAPVDRDAISDLSQFLGARRDEVRKRLDHYGQDFNVDSPPQVAELLYGRLKLKPGKVTETGKASTGADVLEGLVDKHPIVGDILEYRRIAKLLGTYAEGLYHHIRSDGRVHCNYRVDGTRTGRWSSEDPNLQNIPKADEDEDNPEAKMIKACFKAPPGHVLLQADYKQIEYRVAAMLSADPALIDLFRRGFDMHLGTAKIVAPLFQIDPAIVDKSHWLRHFAKTINFLTLYGGSDYAAAKKLGCEVEKAARVRTAIMGSFKLLARWIQERIAETRATGIAWTMLDGERGRRSPLWRIAEKGDDDKARRGRSNAEHSAINHPVQGSAAEFTSRSLAELVSIIVEEGLPAKLILTVHDSLVLEVPEKYIDEVAWTVHGVMTSWSTPHGVPIEIDMEVGRTWGSLDRYELPGTGSRALEVGAIA